MTVAELRKKLEGVPDNMDVFIEQTDAEFPMSLVERSCITRATFRDGNLKATDDVFVITDES